MLRKRVTDTERKLWRYLRARHLEGFKFFGDFVCYEKRIIVEVAGGLRCVERDDNRDWRFEVQGFKVLRFWNNEVLNNRQGGLEMIREYYL